MTAPPALCRACHLPRFPALVVRFPDGPAVICHACWPTARRLMRAAMTSRPRVRHEARP